MARAPRSTASPSSPSRLLAPRISAAARSLGARPRVRAVAARGGWAGRLARTLELPPHTLAAGVVGSCLAAAPAACAGSRHADVLLPVGDAALLAAAVFFVSLRPGRAALRRAASALQRTFREPVVLILLSGLALAEALRVGVSDALRVGGTEALRVGGTAAAGGGLRDGLRDGAPFLAAALAGGNVVSAAVVGAARWAFSALFILVA